jgi:hypothetical protein
MDGRITTNRFAVRRRVVFRTQRSLLGEQSLRVCR